MLNNSKEDKVKKSHVVILIVCLSLVLALGIGAVVALFLPEKPMASKDEILENIEDFDAEENDFNYTAAYLKKLGIRGFDTAKFKECEKIFINESIYGIESKGVLARETAKLFLEYYYDEIDLNDKTALTDALINCYVEAFGDRYAVYRTKQQYGDYQENMSGSFAGIGVSVNYNEERNAIHVLSVTEGSGAEEAGIVAGDLIVGAAGKTIDEVGYEGLISLIRGKVGDPVEIQLIRGDETITLTVMRKQVVEKSVTYKMLADKIGYIKISGFKSNTPEQFREAIDTLTSSGAEGLIFDLRDNPGGYLDSVVEVIDYLVPKGTRIASYATAKGETVYTAKNDHTVDLPMVVIFNGNTASAGELFSAAIRDYADMEILTAVSVGERTFAKGIMQSTRVFSDGSTLTLTIAYYNPPCNVNYDKTTDNPGITPDFECGEAVGTDAPLAAAYTEIKKLIGN